MAWPDYQRHGGEYYVFRITALAILRYPLVQHASRTVEMEVRQPQAPHPVRFIRFNGLGVHVDTHASAAYATSFSCACTAWRARSGQSARPGEARRDCSSV